MKLASILVPFFLLNSLFVLFAFNNHHAPAQDVNGIWADSNSVNFQHCYAIFSQDGNKLTLSHYLEFKGNSMVEIGEGTIDGNKVTYKVKVTKGIPGWALSGEHFLELTPDGTTLRGSYKDEKGNTGPLVFKKIRP